MEAERTTSETSVDNYFTRQYIPEGNSEKRWPSFTELWCETLSLGKWTAVGPHVHPPHNV
jgi:hypothetical protein